MKKVIYFLLVFSTFFFFTQVKAQTRYDIGLEFAPSLSKIYNKQISSYQYIYPVNYGLKFAVRHNHFIYSTGLTHVTQGSKLIVEITDVENPEGATGHGTYYIRAKSWMLPLTAEYILKSNEKIELSGGLGIYLGYIYSQQFENPFYESQQNGGIVILPTPQQFTDINMFDEFYAGLNVGFSFRVLFNEKLSLLLRPNYLYQLRGKSENNDITGTNRLSSLSIEVGLFYSFGGESTSEEETPDN